ncbi:MAG: hypothetical protein V2I32_09150 [Desulforhopalus sp.]|jgi:hypothetical protein|nr:hypothetical protein [Desulforhopalus sp.]
MKSFSRHITGILLGCLFILHAAAAVAEGGDDRHLAYRVTSYNLGAFADEGQLRAGGRVWTDFQPLLITGSAADILNSEHQEVVSWVEVDAHTANSGGVAVAAEFAASAKLSIQGAFGLTRNMWSPDSADYQGKSSWEANLGVVYHLLNNLSYGLHFGYMDTGDLFSDKSSYADVESIIMISNRLTMSF